MRNHWIKRCIGIGIACVAGAFLLGYVVMALWNWLMPELFGLGMITYWKAFGILVLAKILFGGFRGRHGCGCGYGGHWRGGWHSRWKQKWEGMSEEERAKFRKCCDPDCCEQEEKKEML
ncbi:MAG: hypothetical protein HY063_07625 [Bacteroidetes bacterium]|nr:hypothetical protein [Bacteroidota bacterium]